MLAIAGLRDLFDSVVCIDDVEHGKPAPDGYLLALARLNAGRPEPVGAGDVLVFEDADVGVAAAHAAGMRCVAISGDAYHGERATADLVVAELDPDDVDALLG